MKNLKYIICKNVKAEDKLNDYIILAEGLNI